MDFEQLVEHIYQWLKQSEKQLMIAAPFLLAVSGGVDSVILFHAFVALRQKYGIQFKVAHINHQLRIDAAKREQNFIAEICRQNDVAIFERVWQHQGIEHLTENVEAQAREFRYQNFADIMRAEEIQQLVTAHHMNDQAETVLMRLIHGNRIESISGIRAISPLYTWPHAIVIRPLLKIEKNTLYEIAAMKKLPFFEDESNQDMRYTRNRMRQQLIPLLEKENHKAVQHLADFGQDSQALIKFAKQSMADIMPDLVQINAADWEINLAKLEKFSQPQQLLLLQHIFDTIQIAEMARFPRVGMEKLLAFLSSETPQGEWALPADHRIVKVYDKAYIFAAQAKSSKQSKEVYPLVLNQWQAIADHEVVQVGLFEKMPETGGNYQIINLSTAPNSDSLTIRHRQAGDYVELSNGSHQKLRRYFINNKIPSEQRDSAWLLVDSDQKVLVIWPPDAQYAKCFAVGRGLMLLHSFYN